MCFILKSDGFFIVRHKSLLFFAYLFAYLGFDLVKGISKIS